MTTIYTFGDSILDCGVYNHVGVNPGGLLVRNNDGLFPEFRGRDLASRGSARLEHHAVDGSTVEDLKDQPRGLEVEGPALALLTIGGNDLLQGLAHERGPDLRAFARLLEEWFQALPDPPVLRWEYLRSPRSATTRTTSSAPVSTWRWSGPATGASMPCSPKRPGAGGSLVDLHGHFLTGDPSWLVRDIEPSLIGASEVRRCFLDKILGGLR